MERKTIMQKMDELGYTDVGEYERYLEEQATMKYTERWMPVLGYEDLYEVSDYGRVRNAEGKILKPQPYGGQREYRAVGLSRHSKQKTTGIHRLVAECFVGLPTTLNPDGTPMLTSPEINHIDGDPANNYYTNLEWCDRYYNNAHRVGSDAWNYTKKTKSTGRKQTTHSTKYYINKIAYINRKIAELKHENELLREGKSPDSMMHTHSADYLHKKLLKNLERVKELDKQLAEMEKALSKALAEQNSPIPKLPTGNVGKPIITVIDGVEQEWDCVVDFANAVGVTKATVYQCLSGRSKTVKGHTVSWKE